MQQTKKLQQYMSPSNTGQQQIELVKASQCLSELGNNTIHCHHSIIEIFHLDHFTVDADFTGIDAVEKDLQFVFKARHDIQTQAQDVLENGLNHLVCHKIFIFINKLFNFSIESCTNWYSITSIL